MNDTTARTTARTTVSAEAAPSLETLAALLAGPARETAPAALTDTSPVTGGRGVEADDVKEMLAELRLIQRLRRA